MLKLNLGCGDNKIPGYINIDSEKSCKPDLILDIAKRVLPYKRDSVDEILMFHCIEHLKKQFHRKILLDMNRILKPAAKLYLSYPNFWECAKLWYENKTGDRRFWEATLYGRQLYPGDTHVCVMNPDELAALLYECGFKDVISFPEPSQNFNTVTVAAKDPKGPVPTYETIVACDMQNMIVQEI